MRVEVLLEDRSGVPVLTTLMARTLADRPDVQLNVRPHRGKGTLPAHCEKRPLPFASGLLDLLPAKCRAYEAARTVDVLVIALDADRDDPDHLYRTLEATVRRESPSLAFVMAIAVEEMESWLLGDPKALALAYPDHDRSVVSAYVQDSVVGTWEILCRALVPDRAERLIADGYPTIGQYKAEWASRIAPHLDPWINKSPSFCAFRDRLRRIVALVS